MIQDSFKSFSVVDAGRIEGTSFQITDVDSIQKCTIPYQLDNITYNYCASLDNKFKCKTEESSFDECSKGLILI